VTIYTQLDSTTFFSRKLKYKNRRLNYYFDYECSDFMSMPFLKAYITRKMVMITLFYYAKFSYCRFVIVYILFNWKINNKNTHIVTLKNLCDNSYTRCLYLSLVEYSVALIITKVLDILQWAEMYAAFILIIHISCRLSSNEGPFFYRDSNGMDINIHNVAFIP